MPAADFLDGCPPKVRGTILAVLDAVAAAPPPAFSGGGKWEAMHGDMGGYYEIRVTGPGREQFRLFCLLENADKRTLTARRAPARPAAPLTDQDARPAAGILCWALDKRTSISAPGCRTRPQG